MKNQGEMPQEKEANRFKHINFPHEQMMEKDREIVSFAKRHSLGIS